MRADGRIDDTIQCYLHCVGIGGVAFLVLRVFRCERTDPA